MRIFLLLALCLVPNGARAEELRQPRKLTVALSDELLGQLSPDEKHLYFLSNREATTQVLHQDLDAPKSTLLFDDAADVTGPRLSPDGKKLAYVSFRDEATGQLCVRELPSAGVAGERRCLAGEGALEAVWRGPDELLLLARGAVEGDLRLVRVRLDGKQLRQEPLGAGNLTGPATSPDGKWLAYVPVAREAERIGPAFAAQAARALVLRRLDGGAELRVRFDLSGLAGQPAFSSDGRWLYFTEFLNDTDQNGRVDGDDHGVVFRVPFDGARAEPVTLRPAQGGDGTRLAAADPEQVTVGSWNCQYPNPARTLLVVTCARSGSLDLYSLPLDGIVPSGWAPARVAAELASSRDPWERLLLLRRLERAAPDADTRATLLLETVRLHFLEGEYTAALAHAEALAQAGSPSLSPLARVLPIWIAERRAMHDFDHGELGQRVIDDARARLGEVLRAAPDDTPALSALRQVIASELLDDLGDKQGAAAALERALVDEHTPAFVVEARAARAEKLLRALDRGDELVAQLRALVDHPSLPPPERLRLGGVYARSLVRGLGPSDALARLDRERAGIDASSVRAFWLGLAACLTRLRRDTLADGGACVDALYGANPDVARRRVLVAEVVRKAEDVDADDLEFQLAKRWSTDVPRDSPERRHAERLYRHVAEDWGYVSLAAGRYERAAAEFEAVTRQVESLESHIALIEARLATGHSVDDVEREYTKRYGAAATSLHFARAYLGTRRLHDLDGKAFDAAYEATFAELKTVEKALPQKCEVQALHATLLHLKYLRTRDATLAERANLHYLLALDLAHDNARYRAMVLEQVALLHEQVGNSRLALGYFDDRVALPFAVAEVALGHHLAKARALLHAGRDAEAAKEGAQAVTLVETTPALGRFAPLVLDRAALYALAAGDGKAALAGYDRLEHAGESEDPRQRPRNRILLHLDRAAAALDAGQPDRALADLDAVDAAVADPAGRAALRWPDSPPVEVDRTYDLLRLGLRQQAEHALGKLAKADRDGSARHELLALREHDRGLDDDLLALVLAEAQLAEIARRRGVPSEVGRLASLSLAHADEFAKRSSTPLADAQLDALDFAAQAHLVGGVPARAFAFDLAGRLRDAYDQLSSAREPARQEIRRRFAVYLALLALDPVAATSRAQPAR